MRRQRLQARDQVAQNQDLAVDVLGGVLRAGVSISDDMNGLYEGWDGEEYTMSGEYGMRREYGRDEL